LVKTKGIFILDFTPALNGIRGIAVFMVMMFHAGFPFLTGGFIGVDLFFVLSGFLITALLLKEFRLNGKIELKKFYVRRMLRLMPALILLLITFATLSFIFLDRQLIDKNLIEAVFAFFYISNIALAFSISPIVFLGHTWSLAMEEQFYLAWPILLIVLMSAVKSMRKICLLVFMMALSSWALRIYFFSNLTTPFIDRIFYGPDTRADGLLVGCTLAILVSSELFNRVRAQKFFILGLKYLSAIAFIVLILCAFFVSIGSPHLYYWQLFAIELFVAIVILDAVSSEKSIVKSILEWRLLVWIGSISYGLYLWHFLVYGALASTGYDRNEIFLIGFPLTFAIASLSYYLIERPLLQVKEIFR